MAIKTISGRTGEKLWGGMDGILEGIALVLSLIFLPFFALGRSIKRLVQHSKVDSIRCEYEASRRELELASRVPGEFLTIYLKRLAALRSRFLNSRWNSLEEAQAGYRLLLTAEAALMEEAQETINSLKKSKTIHQEA